jgi:hypothetical protein
MNKTVKLVLECALSVCVVLVLFVALAAWAQPLPATDSEAFDLAKTLWGLFVTKQYAAAFGPGVTLAVWALKKWDTKIPGVGPAIDKFLDQPAVSFALPVGISALGGLVTALATGHSFTDALGAVFAASSSAVTTYIGLKKLDEQFNAGEKAAATVDSKVAAISVLKKEDPIK